MTLNSISQWIAQTFGPSAPVVNQAQPAPAPAHALPPTPPPPGDKMQLATQAPKLQPLQVLLADAGIGLAEGVQTDPGVSAATRSALESIPGSSWAGKLASNGKREAAIILPKGFDASKPAEVVYYFHGHNGKIASSLTDPQKGLAGSLAELAQKRNIILVIPQGPPKELDYSWMNPANKESLLSFQQDTLAKIQQMAPGVQIASVTLKGHSAGGLPLLNGLSEAAKKGGLRVDRVDFLDASYGNWASASWQKLKQLNPQAAMNVVYIPGTKTQSDALSLKNKAGVSLQISKVDHGQVPKTFFAD